MRQTLTVLMCLAPLVLHAKAPLLKGSDLVIPSAYQQVGTEKGVPPQILYSVALAESGKKLKTGSFRPYPWTVVTRGSSQRFQDQQEATSALRDLLSRRVTNVDVGVMQTNMYWHGYRYPSPEQAMSPWINLRVGADILREEYGSRTCKKDWWCAVARYHSYRKGDGEKYAARVRRYHTALAAKAGGGS